MIHGISQSWIDSSVWMIGDYVHVVWYYCSRNAIWFMIHIKSGRLLHFPPFVQSWSLFLMMCSQAHVIRWYQDSGSSWFNMIRCLRWVDINWSSSRLASPSCLLFNKLCSTMSTYCVLLSSSDMHQITDIREPSNNWNQNQNSLMEPFTT